jgi:hypothetical protein
MDRINLTQDRDQCGGALVNMVMNLGLRKILGSSWFAAQLLASQEGLNSMKLVSKSVSQNVLYISVLPHRNLMVIPSLAPRYSVRT